MRVKVKVGLVAVNNCAGWPGGVITITLHDSNLQTLIKVTPGPEGTTEARALDHRPVMDHGEGWIKVF